MKALQIFLIVIISLNLGCKKKGKAEFISMLNEAYNKATIRDLSNIDFLKKDKNPENYIRIYDAYVALDNRQERIKPLLPLYVNSKEVRFNFNNYNNDIINFNNSSLPLCKGI